MRVRFNELLYRAQPCSSKRIIFLTTIMDGRDHEHQHRFDYRGQQPLFLNLTPKRGQVDKTLLEPPP